MNIITPSGPSTHSEAFFGGLQADIMGDGEFLQAQINERILKENEVRGPRIALDRALDYACTWAFVTGYGTVIKAKIGLLDGHITVFLVFKDTRINDGRRPGEVANSAGNIHSAIKPEIQVQLEGISVLGHGGENRITEALHVLKYKVAVRILQLMVRFYGNMPFPTEIRFAEYQGAENAPIPILFHRREEDNAATSVSCYMVQRHIIQHIKEYPHR